MTRPSFCPFRSKKRTYESSGGRSERRSGREQSEQDKEGAEHFEIFYDSFFSLWISLRQYDANFRPLHDDAFEYVLVAVGWRVERRGKLR